MSSSRFYGKPLATICGKAMIKWVYEHCKDASVLSDVFVATDHQDIATYCDTHDIPFFMTSTDHKNCAERTNEICKKLGSDLIVEIQGDEPTLSGKDIDGFVERSNEIQDYDVTMLYTDLPAALAKNSHIVKLVFDKNSRALFFSRCPIPLNFKSRAVKYYKQIGLYLWCAGALEKFSSSPPGYLEKTEDTHMLRLIEYHFNAFVIYSPKDMVGVDVPDDIAKAEDHLKVRINEN